jgi:fructose-bisphosphate aldolase, class II
MEQIHGLFLGAQKGRSPIIVQFTPAIRRYAEPRMLEAMLQGAESVYPDVVFSVHLDHGDEASCDEAIASGRYSSVMIDASDRPFSENVAITRRIVEKAHAAGIAVEAEVGLLQGLEDGHFVGAGGAALTDPTEAKHFVSLTQCDTLAVAIGTSHGAYKFGGGQRLDFHRLTEIQEHVAGVPLVLHGGSAVPREEVQRINAAGGALDPTAGGVSDAEIAQAIILGVSKVNVGTDGRLIWTRVHREFFVQSPKEFDFMRPGRRYVDEYAAFVAAKCERLGSAGKADPAAQNSFPMAATTARVVSPR